MYYTSFGAEVKDEDDLIRRRVHFTFLGFLS